MRALQTWIRPLVCDERFIMINNYPIGTACWRGCLLGSGTNLSFVPPMGSSSRRPAQLFYPLLTLSLQGYEMIVPQCKAINCGDIVYRWAEIF